MDIREAIELVDSGRFSELDTEVLWQIQDVLSMSGDADALRCLAVINGPAFGVKMAQKSLEMQAIINNNISAVEKIEKNYNVFALDANQAPVTHSLLPIFNFYKRITVENKPIAEEVKKEDLFMQNAEIARVNGLKEILLDTKFSTLPAEEQKKTYTKAITMALEENAFVLVANQSVENRTGQKQSKLSLQEKAKISNEVEKRFTAMIDPENKATFNLSNSNIISTTVAEFNRLSNAATQILKYTGSKDMVEEVAVLDNKLSKLYPDSLMIARPLAQSSNIGMIAGRIGLGSMVAANIATEVHKNNPAKEDDSPSMFKLFKEKPKTFKKFKENVVDSLKKVYTSVSTLIDLGYLNNKLSLGWKKVATYLFLNSTKKLGAMKGVDAKSLTHNLSIMSADASRALNEPDNQRCVVAWKEFHKKFVNSPVGKMLDAERCLLVSENPAEYTDVVKIVLKKQVPTQGKGVSAIASKSVSGEKTNTTPKSNNILRKMIQTPIMQATRNIVRGQN